MTNRGNVGGALLTIAMTAAMWAWSGGVASAQVVCELCPPPAPPPPEIVTCPVPGSCTNSDCSPTSPVSCSNNPDTPFTSSQNVKVFTFGRDNSIQIKFAEVTCSIQCDGDTFADDSDRLSQPVEVDGSATTPPEPSLSDDGAAEVTCNETVSIDMGVSDDPTSFCAVYHLSADQPRMHQRPGLRGASRVPRWLESPGQGQQARFLPASRPG